MSEHFRRHLPLPEGSHGQVPDGAARSEQEQHKGKPITLSFLSHGTREDDMVQLQLWADRGRAAIQANPTGRVAFVIEDETGTREYSDMVRALVRGRGSDHPEGEQPGIRPSEAKIQAAIKLYVDAAGLEGAEREAVIREMRADQEQGFEGSALAYLDSIFADFGPDRMDVIVEYQPDDYEIPVIDIAEAVDAIATADLPEDTKITAFRSTAAGLAPGQRYREENFGEVIAEAAVDDEVIAVHPFAGVFHVGLLEDLSRQGFTNLDYTVGETYDDKYHFEPLTGLYLLAVREPDKEFTDEEIRDAVRAEEVYRNMRGAAIEFGDDVSQQQLLAEANLAYSVDKEIETGQPYVETIYDLDTMARPPADDTPSDASSQAQTDEDRTVAKYFAEPTTEATDTTILQRYGLEDPSSLLTPEPPPHERPNDHPEIDE